MVSAADTGEPPQTQKNQHMETGAEMDPFGNDEIARLLRLKRYEQPPASYYENFLSEFRRRQRDQLLRQPVWRICFERAHGFALRHNVRPYPVGIAAVVACAAVNSITIYQQPDATQFAVQSLPVPTRSQNTEKEFDFAPRGLIPTFNGDPTFHSGEIRVLDSNGAEFAIGQDSAERLSHNSETIPLLNAE
jgi:hypothetical protein